MAFDPLTTLNSLKAWLKVTGNNDDPELTVLIAVASEAIGRACNRPNLGQVYTYTENYFVKRGGFNKPNFDLILRQWPVTALASVFWGPTPIPILTPQSLLSGQWGCYLLEMQEPRLLKFIGAYSVSYGYDVPIQIAYSAGYPPGAVPAGLQQAANQYASEIYRSRDWIGYRSRAIGGETTTFDPGSTLGMSARTKAMIAPYLDQIPFMGY